MPSDADRRTERPLGRGLEDISHLFLSRQAEERQGASVVERTVAGTDTPPEVRAGATVLRAGEPITREKLRVTLRECQGALETNLRTIDACIPCRPDGEIDLLAVDTANRLVVIDVEIAPHDDLFLRGVAGVDWLVRHLPMLRHFYSAWAIDFSRQPRLVFVAPSFSELLINAAHSVAGPEIACFRYRSVKIAAGTGIFFEQVGRDGY
jgi:hypothetical protein